MSFLIALTLAAGPCAAALKAAPEYTECTAAGPGVALALTAAEAKELIDIGQDARTRFLRYFPASPRRYVLFFADDTPPVEALKAAGFVSVLPWASPEKIAGLAIESGLRRAAEQAGRPVPANVEQRTRAKLPQMVARQRAQQRDVLAHELGHLWYHDAYWRGRIAPDGGYGTPGPDWLDETAAILMEGAEMSDGRRTAFRAAWTAVAPDARFATGEIGDVGHFLTRKHPTNSGTAAPRTASVSVAVGNGSKGQFYDQARVFADYLLDRTGDPRVFDAMARSIAKGITMDRWFADQRHYPKLPRSIAALQSDWAAWIDRPR